MNGIERFVKRVGSVTDVVYINTRPVSIDNLIGKMADELCDLLEWRDRMEGKMDNPPSIDDCIPDLTGLRKELGRE